jgi:CubicO group peptidase (beta-lactamase class C family)
MNKVVLIIALCLIKFVSLSCQSASEKIDLLMKSYYDNGVFNGAVLVSVRGEVIYKKAFGIADREWNVPVTTDTKFKIASLSKSFTALAIMQLVQEGNIRLDGTIKDYIPDYDGKLGDSITIYQLLTHSSGIKSNLDPKEEFVKQRIYHELRDIIKYSESTDLMFNPGTRFGYSNFGYNILAYIIQMVTGKSYDVVLKEKIFDPAGMNSTSQYVNSKIEEKLAKGYEYKLLYGYRNPDYVDASLTVGPGGLISTIEDLYLFDRALYSGKLIKNEYNTEIFISHKPGNYGFGWFISKRKMAGIIDSANIADHSGSIDGFGSYMARITNDSSFVVVLKNQRADTYIDPAFAPEIGSQIISILYGEKVEIPKISIARHIATFIGNCGIDSAIEEYYRIVRNQPGKYNLEEAELNRLGIELLFRFNMNYEALKVFEVNMHEYARSYNTYDSFAYALMQKGDLVNSIKYYRKGLEILDLYPGDNNLDLIKSDSDKAIVYIKVMEEKLNKCSPAQMNRMGK